MKNNQNQSISHLSRDIKFRAFDKQDKIMRKPLTLDEIVRADREFESEDEENSLPHSDYIFHAHKDTIWMQYIWMKDKLWEEIYEWDILLEHNYKNEPVKVVCIYKRWVFGYIYYKIFNSKDRDLIIPIEFGSLDHYQVIGNVYQNPELLR